MMLAALALLAAGGCRGRPAEPLPAELARHDEPVRLIEFGTPAARELLREGWWRDESDGGVPHLWTGERRARLLVPWGEPGEVSGQIVCRRLGAALDPPQTVRITCRGRELAVFAPEPVWAAHEVRIPAGVLQAGLNEISLEFARCDRPSVLGISTDLRPLAVGFRSWRLLPPLPSAPQLAPGQLAIPSGGRLSWAFAGRPGEYIRLAAAGPAGRAFWSADSGRLTGPEQPFGGPDERVRLEVPDHPGPLALTLAVPHIHPPAWTIVEPALEPPPAPLVRPPAPPSVQPADRPNIVLFIADALNPAFTGAWGDPRAHTPALDRLARSGTAYADAESAAPYTMASVATILTGLFPERHGVLTDRRRLPPETASLAEQLAAAGYRTALAAAVPYAGRMLGFDRGFDRVFELFDDGLDVVQSEEVTAILDGLLDELGPGPWFLYVHLREPHGPYDPAPPLDRLLDDRPARAGAGADALDAWDRDGCPPEVLADLRRLYAGNVAEADRALEVALRCLAARPAGRPTWFFFGSDHGEAFGAHGRLLHNSTIYGDMLAVPLVAAPAGGGPVRLESEPVSLADLAPTFLWLAGLPEPDGLDGRRLPGFGPAAAAGPRAFCSRSGEEPETLIWALRGVRLARWRAIWRPVDALWELYDLTADPGEQHDLASERPVTLELAAARLRAHEARPAAAIHESDAAPDEETLDHLRALGYID